MLGRSLIISGFVSFGDILYSTPMIRFIKKRSEEVHVWSCNPEPLMNNPDIDELWDLRGHELPIIPHWYFDKVYRLKNDGPLVRGMSRFHTIDFFSLNTFGILLRKKNKDLILHPYLKDECRVIDLMAEHGLSDQNFVVISPTISWPSRTLPLEYYKELVKRILTTGVKVVLVGKEVDPGKLWDSPHLKSSGLKQIYPIEGNFEGAINLINQLTFMELAALYAKARIAINTENGNMVVSCTNNTCWNVYIPSVTAPEFRLPWRNGSQEYKTVVVGNKEDWYPQDTTSKEGNLITAEVKLPTIDEIFDGYLQATWGWRNGYTSVSGFRI